MHDIVQIMMPVVVVAVLYDLIVGLPWIGRTSRIVDGDSVEAVTRGKLRRIRIRGIDAPEYKQDHGRTARTAMVDLVEGRLVLFLPFGRDSRGRFLCVMVTTGGPVSWRMALAGHAWPESFMTRILHVPARMARRGLWGGSAQLPSTWRRINPWNGRR